MLSLTDVSPVSELAGIRGFGPEAPRGKGTTRDGILDTKLEHEGRRDIHLVDWPSQCAEVKEGEQRPQYS